MFYLTSSSSKYSYSFPSSSIIQDLDAERVAGLASVVYYYFDFRDAGKQNRQGFLSSLLLQLASESDRCYEILSRLYTTHTHGARKPNDVALMHCLKDMLEQHRQATYIIIDAIDECPNTTDFPTPREKVLEFLEGLIDLQLPHLRICIASRPEADIRDTLEPLTTLRVSLHEESGQRKDILDYVTKVVRTDKQMRKWREEDKILAIRILAEKSEGM
jgi:NACHT domain